MRRMSPSTSVIGFSVMLTLLVVPGTVAGQQCSWSLGAGLSIPATTDLRVEGHRTDLDLGWLGRVGRTCESGTRRYAVDADAQRLYGFGGMYLFSLTGRLGRIFRVDPDPRGPWLELSGSAGFSYAFDPATYVEVLVPPRPERTPGRVIDLPGLGITAGGGLQANFPAGAHGTFLLDVGFRATLMPTRKTNGLLRGTRRVLVTLPITLGYRLTL